MHLVVVDTQRFVKISRHLYCYRRCCNIYIYIFRCYCYPFSFFFFKVELYNLIDLIKVYS